jgi:hypothetical protein
MVDVVVSGGTARLFHSGGRGCGEMLVLPSSILSVSMTSISVLLDPSYPD